MRHQSGNAISGANNFITPASPDTQTFKTNPLGYTGKYDNHIEPVIALMTSLRQKITNSLEGSKADAAYEDARVLDEHISAKSKQEIEM
jgi:hypothetical protein